MPEGFGFKAWISTEDGEALPEYGIEADLENKVISCWIPSEAGKKFKVMWSNLAHYTKDTNERVKIDGIRVGGAVYHKRDSVQAPATLEEIVTSPNSVRQFIFSPLNLTDDDSLIGEPSAHNIRIISLELREIIIGERRTARVRSVHEQHTIHEKSNKGVVHCVGFTPEQTRPDNIFIRDVSVIETLGMFVFRYRPLDFLQANGIAPRDSSPEIPAYLQSDLSAQETRIKRKADAIKEEDVDGNEEINEDSEEMESIRDRIRELEREKELDRLRARLRKLEGKKNSSTKRVKKESHATAFSEEVIYLT